MCGAVAFFSIQISLYLCQLFVICWPNGESHLVDFQGSSRRDKVGQLFKEVCVSLYFPPRRHGFGGFLLLQTLIVVATLALMSLLFMPSFERLLAQTRVEATWRWLFGTLMQARRESMHGRRMAIVCRIDAKGNCTSEEVQCHGVRAASDQWQCGWKLVLRGTASEHWRWRTLRVVRPPPGVRLISSITGNFGFQPPLGHPTTRPRTLYVETMRQGGRQALAPTRCLIVTMSGAIRDGGKC